MQEIHQVHYEPLALLLTKHTDLFQPRLGTLKGHKVSFCSECSQLLWQSNNLCSLWQYSSIAVFIHMSPHDLYITWYNHNTLTFVILTSPAWQSILGSIHHISSLPNKCTCKSHGSNLVIACLLLDIFWWYYQCKVGSRLGTRWLLRISGELCCQGG